MQSDGDGTVSWTSNSPLSSWTEKTNADSPVAAAAGDRLMLNTSGGTITVNLPASPSDGDEVTVVPGDNTDWSSNNVTIGRNSENIDGLADDDTLNKNQYVKYVYNGSTTGWESSKERGFDTHHINGFKPEWVSATTIDVSPVIVTGKHI